MSKKEILDFQLHYANLQYGNLGFSQQFLLLIDSLDFDSLIRLEVIFNKNSPAALTHLNVWLPNHAYDGTTTECHDHSLKLLLDEGFQVNETKIPNSFWTFQMRPWISFWL